MENPLSGMELFVGTVTGLVGFVSAVVADRFIATRDGATVKGTAVPIYSDWYRLGAGVGLAAVPLVLAHFIKSPVWRSGVQFFGVAALLHLGGKLLVDVAAKVLHDNDTGKRLFAAEIAAQDMLAAAEKKQGGGALPNGTGTGKPDDRQVPPPPAFQGRPSPAAIEAVKKHPHAIVALGQIAPDVEARDKGVATHEQLARIDAFNRQFGTSLSELSKFEPQELQAAVGVAGLQALANRPPPPAQRPASPQRAPQPPAADDGRGPYNWANND